MKNLFKTFVMVAFVSIVGCSKNDDTANTSKSTNIPGSFIAGQVGSFSYDSRTGGGQTFATKVTLPIVGTQISLASALSDTKTLNLTFIAPATVGTISGVLFYSPNGTAASSIGNDDNCSGVSCNIIVTKNDGKVLEGTFTAMLKKADCTGASTSVSNGSFKAVVAL